jgi:hypothetical protein
MMMDVNLHSVAAALLATYTVCRPVLRCKPISRNKLTAEYAPRQEPLWGSQDSVGLNRQHPASPDQPAHGKILCIGSHHIIFILITESCSFEDLKTLVGRLNHVYFISTCYEPAVMAPAEIPPETKC